VSSCLNFVKLNTTEFRTVTNQTGMGGECWEGRIGDYSTTNVTAVWRDRNSLLLLIMPPRRHKEMFCLTSVCLSVAYIGPKSRTERPRKTKIGTEVAHATRDTDTTFQGQNVKGKLVADILNSQHAGTGATWRINTKILSTRRGRRPIVSPRAQLIIIIIPIIIRLLNPHVQIGNWELGRARGAVHGDEALYGVCAEAHTETVCLLCGKGVFSIHNNTGSVKSINQSIVICHL